MIYGSISRRYAKALFDLGQEKNLLSQFVLQIEQFNTLWNENPELRHALTSPTVPLRLKKDVLNKIATRMAAQEPVKRFLTLLVVKQRVESISLIYFTLKAMADRKEGILRGEVVSAFPLDPPQFSYIVQSMEKKIGKKVILTREVDPALIGGIVIKIEDKIIDGSVKSQLEDVRKTIIGDINP
jgi:F-type H+-transporting ATPase subunit delta